MAITEHHIYNHAHHTIIERLSEETRSLAEQRDRYDSYYEEKERANKIPLSFDNWCAKYE